MATRVPRLGLVVNPLAGLGGAVGLKGSDGALAARARALGAEPVAPARAGRLLRHLAAWAPLPEIVTCAGDMGERLAREAGFAPRIAFAPAGRDTHAADTQAAVRALARLPVDLLLFVGGDGTARDVLAALAAHSAAGSALPPPVLGVPAGVKMHSGVFATGPRAAGEVAQRWWSTGCGVEDAEVVDREPAADGSPSGPVRLYGALRVPRVRERLQRAKAQGADGDALLEGACERIAVLARDERVTLLGPGSTLRRIKRRLGFEGTLLGVDAVRGGVPLAVDAGERRLLELVESTPARIVVTAIGGQGFVFGRGNQPLSPRVIRAVGLENVIVVASATKLATLPGSALYVDTGDPALDRALAGHRSVITGAQRQSICRVRAADA
ncbi:MAG: NAD(+)/NADH kinase [Steroidobacteraceae bacterium]|jgi:predicted polyphosphate/ATP-dependent NAD kinase|nr:NAD(+)/NADH kinase [Steroidobacteraceae bacterium]